MQANEKQTESKVLRSTKVGTMLNLSALEIINLMKPLLSESRQSKIQNVVQERTYSVCTVLENIYDRGNISAVLRSAEAMGFQDVHIIESEKFKSSNRVTKGADKWLNVYSYKNTSECIQELKNQKYKIIATHLDDKSKSLDEMDWSQKMAFVLGNEKDGISKEMIDSCDERIVIPMQGFVQSFNISVAAAIGLYRIYLERKNLYGHSGDLTETQKQELIAEFYLRSSKNPEKLLRKLLERQK